MNRVFVAVAGASVDAGEWLAGLKAGRTFATNGPLLDFSLGGRPIGSELQLARPTHAAFTAHLRSIVPIDHLEIVCNGRVVRSLPLKGGRTEADLSGQLPMDTSGWCVLRASSDRAEYPVLDNYPYATTSPVYVTMAGRPQRATEDAAFFVAWVERVIEATSRYPDWNSSAEKDAVLARLREAQALYAARR
jgi:hypothetical protein